MFIEKRCPPKPKPYKGFLLGCFFNMYLRSDYCLNARRVWASTPQIADYTDYADDADF